MGSLVAYGYMRVLSCFQDHQVQGGLFRRKAYFRTSRYLARNPETGSGLTEDLNSSSPAVQNHSQLRQRLDPGHSKVGMPGGRCLRVLFTRSSNVSLPPRNPTSHLSVRMRRRRDDRANAFSCVPPILSTHPELQVPIYRTRRPSTDRFIRGHARATPKDSPRSPSLPLQRDSECHEWTPTDN